ncbi:hypothetical protein IFU23_14000 [Pantoea agglomerans]|uniref:hypothetical protein n=1 Tax=Enterobacter agglomerans TaxID=549 RepID=UPI0017857E37|nr:hypothetical protein [Pantoea agglomerans]MBD8159213.1 hypothetical protein [Pantoea agglomerans]MBD8230295.1 hypothetical protein [Pantoea agglomerans]
MSREVQCRVMQILWEKYPYRSDEDTYEEIYSLFDDESDFHRCLIYLEELGLIESGLIATFTGYSMDYCGMRLTREGADQVLGDESLGANLKVQIVKIHDSTIVALEDILLLSNLPEEQKKGLVAKLRELPADAIKHLTLQLLTKAALNPQAALHIIQTALHHG